MFTRHLYRMKLCILNALFVKHGRSSWLSLHNHLRVLLLPTCSTIGKAKVLAQKHPELVVDLGWRLWHQCKDLLCQVGYLASIYHRHLLPSAKLASKVLPLGLAEQKSDHQLNFFESETASSFVAIMRNILKMSLSSAKFSPSSINANPLHHVGFIWYCNWSTHLQAKCVSLPWIT